MAKKTSERPAPAPTRLGRGLGNLIPVPVQRQVFADPSDPSNVSSSNAPSNATPPQGHQTAMSPEWSTSTQPNASRPLENRNLHSESDFQGAGGMVEFVALGALRAGRYQPRGSMDQAGLEALAASIATSGLMQPLVVRPIPTERGAYEVIAGERRWRALERLGRREAPVIVRRVGDQEAAELSLVENLQREDLNPMDRAAALQRLADEFSLTHQELAQRIGIDRATVTNLVRLNDLDAETASHVRDGTLSAGHAKVLLGVQDVARRCGLAALAIKGGWSVRQLEQQLVDANVPRGTSRRAKGASSPSAYVATLERELQEHLGTRVAVRLGRKKGVGELRIQFFSLDEFDGLMQRIGFQDKSSRLRV